MRKKVVTVALAAGVGLAGAGLVAPAIASAQSASPSPSASASPGASNGVSERVSRIADALQGLVTDGTIDQSQADRVAQTLAESLPQRGGPGGHGHGGRGGVGATETAEVLGITVEELRTQLEAGTTLAQVAEAEGISKADLISRLVDKAEEHLAEEVAEGDLTQAQADEKRAALEERITARVDQVGGLRGGRGHSHGPDGDDDATPAPSASSSAGA